MSAVPVTRPLGPQPSTTFIASLDQRFHDVRIGQGGRVADLIHGVLGNLAQNAAHDFARAASWQSGVQIESCPAPQSPDFLADMVASSF